MEDWEKLAYDHEQTVKYFHALADTRFKLLAFVPLVTGGAVVALSPATSPVQSGLLGIFGFLVTLGISFYDRRNTHIYDAISVRAKSLEALMALPRLGNTRYRRSGPFLHRPERTVKLFGVWKMWHDRGLSIIYSTALAAWMYLAVSGATHYYGVTARCRHLLQGSIPLLVWVLFLIDYHRCDTATDATKALPTQIAKLVMQPPSPSWGDDDDA
jgi:hypothetical protein